MLNKSGNVFLTIFIFIIVAFFVTLIGVMFVYMGNEVSDKLHEQLDNRSVADSAVNYSETIDDTMGEVNIAYGTLYWIAIFLMVGMVIAIFIGAYMVTYKPVFFVPYIFMVIIAIIVSVGISNGYSILQADATMAETFTGFAGANFILLKLPIWISVIGIVGGVIMVLRLRQAGGDYSYG